MENTAISKTVLFCYGFGHLFNDLTASMWFSYLLIYFHLVLNFSHSLSAAPLFIGQLVDGIATVTVGILSGVGAGHYLCKYGQKKTWHLVGSVCVMISFPFIFSPAFGFQNSTPYQRMAYYLALICIFQSGWAFTQVSHLSLVPQLTSIENERTKLLSIRYTFTVLANITVHLFTWFVFYCYRKSETTTLSDQDMPSFQKIGIFITVIGSLACLVFHTGVSEQPNARRNEDNEQHKLSKKAILSHRGLYHVMALYLSSQLFVNQSQVFIPLYLEECLKIKAEMLPVLPLVMYISGFGMSMLTNQINAGYGRKMTYFIGAILAMAACIWVYFGDSEIYKNLEIFGVVTIFGFASAILAVTCQGVTADFIGLFIPNSSFVYGVLSFVDKIGNGIVVMVVQQLKQHYNTEEYYRNMLIYICGGSAMFGVLFILTLPRDFRLSRKENFDKPVEIENNGTTVGIERY